MKRHTSLRGARLIGAVMLLSALFSATDLLSQTTTRILQFALLNPNFSSANPRTDLNNQVISNATFYPDGQIWLPEALQNQSREILIPVLVRHTLLRNEIGEPYTLPVKSFNFEVQYDNRRLKALGVQKQGPTGDDTYCLAKDFAIESDVALDPTYGQSILPNLPPASYGERIRVVGTSSNPLPLSPNVSGNAADHNNRLFVELLYIRFQVIPNTNGGFPNVVPLIITNGANDTLRVNGTNLTEINSRVPGASPLAGVDNSAFASSLNLPLYKNGVIYVNFTQTPCIGFTPRSQQQGDGGLVRSVGNERLGNCFSQWELVDAVVADSCSADFNRTVGKREIVIDNLVSGSRADNLEISSDSPWLQFSVSQGGVEVVPTTNKGVVPFVDKGILGSLGIAPLNVNGGQTTSQPESRLTIQCDASQIGTVAGRLVGYLTLKSPSLSVSPVRLKVTFVVLRKPIEPNVSPLNTTSCGEGIRLNISNSGTQPQNTTIVFGVAADGTTGVDSLVGESTYNGQLNSFGARWYPRDRNGNDIAVNGMNDLAGLYTSRDIRSASSDTTLVYYCRFNAGGNGRYPITVSWDISDFPEGAQLFIRDTLGGTVFGTDMRNATFLGGTRYSYTIRDSRVSSFIIEYTLPTVVRFTNLKKGWNFVSMPVRPANPDYRAVYTKALEAPRFAASNFYPVEPNGLLRFGVGYFVKYGAQVDSVIAGVRVNKIGQNTPYLVRVDEGWNSIGALSVPSPVSGIQFDPFGTQTADRAANTGVYRYNTDRGYQEVTTLEPGYGYWLKVTGSGYLKMEAPTGRVAASVDEVREQAIASSRKLTIRDNGQREAELYLNNSVAVERFTLPPVPPMNLFDARFASNRYMENTGENVVMLQGLEFPAVITAEKSNMTIVDAVSNEVLGTITPNAPSVTIAKATKAVKLLSTTETGYSLEENYPNPFSGTTTIKFSVPQLEKVTVKVVNAMGEVVATPFDGAANGAMSIDFNANNLTSGTYFVVINAGSFSASRRMVVVK